MVTKKNIQELNARQESIFGRVKYEINERNGYSAIDMPIQGSNPPTTYLCGVTRKEAFQVVTAMVDAVVDTTHEKLTPALTNSLITMKALIMDLKGFSKKKNDPALTSITNLINETFEGMLAERGEIK